jgi:hypothetical protein
MYPVIGTRIGMFVKSSSANCQDKLPCAGSVAGRSEPCTNTPWSRSCDTRRSTPDDALERPTSATTVSEWPVFIAVTVKRYSVLCSTGLLSEDSRIKAWTCFVKMTETRGKSKSDRATPHAMFTRDKAKAATARPLVESDTQGP